MRKELHEHYWKDKKVTVMGLGLLGRGVRDTHFLAEHGAHLTVTDMKSEEILAPSLEQLSAYSDRITYVLGEHQLSDFEEKDFILKAAGVPLDSPYILHAKEKNVPVYMSAALLSQIVMKYLPGVTVIGVTGTRGKSTTTQLIAHILESAGLTVHLGGNIRGVANLPLLDVIEDDEYLVLELDSWQLQGFGDLHISPHIAVFTNFMDDHMNYYKNDREVYFNDKANIYRSQGEHDVLIASQSVASRIHDHDPRVHPSVPETQHFDMKLLGEHNQVLASLAYEVGLECGLDEEEIRKAIKSFSPVAGRLEDMGFFGEKHVRVINDNNATTPDATCAALTAVTATYTTHPILITGGADKGLPLEDLKNEIARSTKACIFLEGTGTLRYQPEEGDVCSTLQECVKRAFEIASPEDIILFSPAFASFSKEFNNEYERNDEFVRCVQAHIQ